MDFEIIGVYPRSGKVYLRYGELRFTMNMETRDYQVLAPKRVEPFLHLNRPHQIKMDRKTYKRLVSLVEQALNDRSNEDD